MFIILTKHKKGENLENNSEVTKFAIVQKEDNNKSSILFRKGKNKWKIKIKK